MLFLVSPGILPALDAWMGVLAFSGQIFFDFAGYSVCAIGAASCLGFVLPQNFLYPYAAMGFSDFWRRWHITLSAWLRDYLYIPLGGNRKGKMRTYINLMITMLLGGLWHGANWTFVVWGGLHGLYLCVEKFIKDITTETTGPIKIKIVEPVVTKASVMPRYDRQKVFRFSLCHVYFFPCKCYVGVFPLFHFYKSMGIAEINVWKCRGWQHSVIIYTCHH